MKPRSLTRRDVVAGCASFSVVLAGGLRLKVEADARPNRRVLKPTILRFGKETELHFHPDYEGVFYLGSMYRDSYDLDGRKRSRLHWGIDLVAKEGTEVIVPGLNLIVAAMAKTSHGGKMVLLKSRDKDIFQKHIYYKMGHLADFAEGLEVNKPVQIGQVVGYVGATGIDMPRSRTPHLHYSYTRAVWDENDGKSLRTIIAKGDKPVTQRMSKNLNPLVSLISAPDITKTKYYFPVSMDFVDDPNKLGEKTISPILCPKKPGRVGYVPPDRS